MILFVELYTILIIFTKNRLLKKVLVEDFIKVNRVLFLFLIRRMNIKLNIND